MHSAERQYSFADIADKALCHLLCAVNNEGSAAAFVAKDRKAPLQQSYSVLKTNERIS